ncbi:sigma-54 dependent transcriptional regulator [bacterium]|nr:sigma-54 dependent transcriptional regulator [bacterium]RIK59285.1 MAG: hypothetical protein DCC62_28770 [candidate division KSB1 bacterium]
MIQSSQTAAEPSFAVAKTNGAKRTILLIDDDHNIHELCRRYVTKAGHDFISAYDGVEGLELIRRGKVDLVLLDFMLPGRDGYSIYKELASNAAFTHVRHVPVIMLTAYPGAEERKRELMELGLSMHIEKPFGGPELIKVIENVFVSHGVRERERQRALTKEQEAARVSAENRALRTQIVETYGFESIIGNNQRMREIFDRIRKVAKTDANILIYGESGTGKELIARSIHAHSHRAKGPFIAVDCVALPGNLLESELYGYEKGAFTGAVAAKRGLLELAHSGTFFLDEITELNLDLQAKLLRVLQERQFRRLGGKDLIEVDMRVISATNREPFEAVKERALRHDLYYRLNVIPITLPPLRERKDDIALLCRGFLQKFSSGHQPQALELSPEALTCLMGYSWPGNVRELQNVMERVASLATGPRIETSDLPEYLRDSYHTPLRAGHSEEQNGVASAAELPLREARQQWMEKFERNYLIELMNRCNGNISRVARKAGVHRMTIYRMLKHYDITISPRRAQ